MGLLFSVACTVLLYTWHVAFKNQGRTAVLHFYTLDVIDFLLLCHMINDQLDNVTIVGCLRLPLSCLILGSNPLIYFLLLRFINVYFVMY